MAHSVFQKMREVEATEATASGVKAIRDHLKQQTAAIAELKKLVVELAKKLEAK